MNKKPVLICENTNVSLKSSKKGNRYVLEGVFAVFGKENRNARIYNEQQYLPHLEYLQKDIENNTLLGELDHPPERFEVSLSDVSHKISEIKYDENTRSVYGKIELLDTPKGKIAQTLLEAGIPLSISSRAAGSVNENKHVEIDQIYTYDLVAKPGFEEAQLRQISESLGQNLGNKITMLAESASRNSKISKSKNIAKKLGIINEHVTILDMSNAEKMSIREEALSINNNNNMKYKNKYRRMYENDEIDFELDDELDLDLDTEDTDYADFSDEVGVSIESAEDLVALYNEVTAKLATFRDELNSIPSLSSEVSESQIHNLQQNVEKLRRIQEQTINWVGSIAKNTNKMYNYTNKIQETVNHNAKHANKMHEAINHNAKFTNKVREAVDYNAKHSNRMHEAINHNAKFTNKVREAVDYNAKFTNKVREAVDYNAKHANKMHEAINHNARFVNKVREAVDYNAKHANKMHEAINHNAKHSNRMHEAINHNAKFTNKVREAVDYNANVTNKRGFSNLKEGRGATSKNMLKYLSLMEEVKNNPTLKRKLNEASKNISGIKVIDTVGSIKKIADKTHKNDNTSYQFARIGKDKRDMSTYKPLSSSKRDKSLSTLDADTKYKEFKGNKEISKHFKGNKTVYKNNLLKEGSKVSARSAKLNERLDSIARSLEKERTVINETKKEYSFTNFLSKKDVKRFAELSEAEKRKVSNAIAKNPSSDANIICKIWENALGRKLEKSNPMWYDLAPKAYKDAFKKADKSVQESIKSKAKFYVLESSYAIENFWEQTGLKPLMGAKTNKLNESVVASNRSKSDNIDPMVQAVLDAMK